MTTIHVCRGTCLLCERPANVVLVGHFEHTIVAIRACFAHRSTITSELERTRLSGKPPTHVSEHGTKPDQMKYAF